MCQIVLYHYVQGVTLVSMVTVRVHETVNNCQGGHYARDNNSVDSALL